MSQEHHRQLRRGGDERPVNKLIVGDLIHDWIHKHPAVAGELGWIVSQHEDPAEVIVHIPDTLLIKEKKERKKIENPKERVNTQIRTPKGEQNVLPELFDKCRDKLEELGLDWKHENNDARYYVLVAVCHDWLTQ